MSGPLTVEMGIQSLPVDLRDTVRRLMRQSYDEGYAQRGHECAADARARAEEERRSGRPDALAALEEAVKKAELLGVGFVMVVRAETPAQRPVFKSIDPAIVELHTPETPAERS